MQHGFGRSIEKLQFLQRLDLSGIDGSCNITILSPKYFEYVKGITYLDVSNCRIKYLSSGSISSLRNLRYLNLSFNEQLSFAILRNLSSDLRSTKIEELKLDKIHCTFGIGTEIFLSDIEYLANISLKKLSLNSNRLESLENGVLLKLPHTLEDLSIADNKFSFGPFVLQTFFLANLKTLNMSYQSRSHNPAEIIKFPCKERQYRCPGNTEKSESHHYTTTQEMNLHLHQKAGRSMTTAPHIFLPLSLETIYCVETKLQYEIPEIIFEQCNVKHLFLQNNIFHKWTGPIRGVASIKILDMSSNFCSDVSRYFFSGFSGLKVLRVQENLLGFSLESDSEGLTFS